MTPLKWLMVVYGLANIGMGLEAFIAKNSVISLVAGGGAGVLMLVCVWLTKDRPRIGYIGASLICLALMGNFLPKFLKDTTKIYPALVVTVMSLILFVALLASHFMATRKSRAS